MVARFDRELSRLYPESRLLTRAVQLAPYESDALTGFRVRPHAVVLAETVDEVVATVRLCARFAVPFVARGSGTSLSGGSLPVAGGLVIALNRLNRILRIDPDQRLAVVEPGVINLAVSAAAAAHGLYYAPDPSSQSICTIGGNAAFNSGGAHCLRYGMTSNHVLAIRAVLPDGEVVTLGSESSESIGPDLVGLFVGSEGLFGIALELTLRLLPRPACYFTLLAAYPSLERAGQAVSAVVSAGMLPSAMEIMDRLAIEAAEAAVGAGYPSSAALLIVELEGEPAEVGAQSRRLEKLMRDTAPDELRIAADGAERERIWKGRKGAFSAVGRLSPDYIVQDGVVPRSRLGEALAEVERLGAATGLRVANVFHAGDGNLHPLILYDGRVSGELERAEHLAGEILRMCIRLGGSITGEHGVGIEKRAFLAEMFGPDDIAAMRRLRASIDPTGLANPGKMFLPSAPAAGAPKASAPGAGAPKASPPGSGGPAPGAAGEPVVSPTEARVVRPESADEVAALVRKSRGAIRVRGAGTKPGLATLPEGAVTMIETTALSGITEYQPSEYTVTVKAGTPIRELATALAAEGQFLPFDPLLAGAGATVGGTIAAATSGPGRLAYGGVRDFLLAVTFVDGTGALVRGGSQVVKNAAGFDLPKLMVGALGRYGPIVEATWKVFPRAEASTTLEIEAGALEAALALSARLLRAPFDVAALDLRPPGTLWARLAGTAEALPDRVAQLQRFLAPELEAGATWRELEVAAERALWESHRELTWAPPEAALWKVALAPRAIRSLDEAVGGTGPRRYSGGGQQLLMAGEDSAAERLRLGAILAERGLRGLALRGRGPSPWIGAPLPGALFERRVSRALDPQGRFGTNGPPAPVP